MSTQYEGEGGASGEESARAGKFGKSRRRGALPRAACVYIAGAPRAGAAGRTGNDEPHP